MVCTFQRLQPMKQFCLVKNGQNVDCCAYSAKRCLLVKHPQSFRLGEILEAHEQMRKINPNYENISDSCTLYNMLGKKVYMVKGNKGNLKVTDLSIIIF